MNKKYFVLTGVCAAALVVTACGGGDAAPVAATATTPINLAPGPTGTAPAAATPTTSVTAPTTTAPAPAAPVTTAPVTTAPVTTAPAGTAPPAATPTTSVTAPTTGAPTTTPTTPAAIVTSLTGSVVKGPVGNATVTAKKPDGTACGTTATNATGQYNFTTSCTGDVIIEVTGGSYLDEATNITKPLTEPLKVVVNAAGGNVVGVVTPLTTMAYSVAFSSSNAATVAAFNAQMVKTAAQFGLANVNLATTLPVVTGSSNAYGNALKAISQYLNDNRGTTLAAFTAPALTTQTALTAFSQAYNSAFFKINGAASNVTFNGDGFTITGTGAGGGSGTCGVTAVGSVTSSGFTVPVNLNYCLSGIAAGSCDAGNLSLNQALAVQGSTAGINLAYTYSAVCAPGAIQINLK